MQDNKYNGQMNNDKKDKHWSETICRKLKVWQCKLTLNLKNV